MKSTINKKYDCNELFFRRIDSKEKAYFLGMMYADGCMTDRSITISLQERDRGILEKLKNTIKYTGPLSFYMKRKENPLWQNSVCLRIYSRELVNDLIKLGRGRHKANELVIPDLDDKYYSHFIRGLFDGDGCIRQGKYGYTFSITGNKTFITEINNLLLKFLDIPPSAITRKNKASELSAALQYSKNSSLIKIRDFLYKDCEDLYIERKYNKFFEIEEKIERFCAICGDELEAKGLCKKHYMFFYLYKNKERVVCTNINTNEEKIFLNIREAEKDLKISYASIWANLHNRNKKAHHYTFRYEKIDLSIFSKNIEYDALSMFDLSKIKYL